MRPYKIVYKGGQGELIEKKSRFISKVFPIHTEEEATSLIEKQKKKYWDARHNCYAYTLGVNNEIQRCSDDGEPSKTAGKPMLDVLLGKKIHNVLVIVTRYFGGTLLGTGGLVRAYSGATQLGLENCSIVEKCFGKKVRIQTDYNGIGKLQYIAGQMELVILNTEYTHIVNLFILLPIEKINEFEKKVTEATSGSATIELLEEVYYAKVENETILF